MVCRVDVRQTVKLVVQCCPQLGDSQLLKPSNTALYATHPDHITLVFCATVTVHTEHLRWISTTFQDIYQCVFHDIPGPCMACRSIYFVNTINTTSVAHCYGTLYILSCHFVSNVSVLTNAQIQLNTGHDQNSALSSNHSERLSKILSHQLFAFHDFP